MVINITNTFVTISISFYNQQRLSFLCSDSIEYHLKTVGSLSRKSHILANIYIYIFFKLQIIQSFHRPCEAYLWNLPGT